MLSKVIAMAPSIIGILGIFILFKVSLGANTPFYVNGVSILLLYLSIILFITSLIFLIQQSSLIINGLTTKELHSIEKFNKEIKENSSDLEVNISDQSYTTESKSCKEKLNNLWKFLFFRIPKSLL